MSQIRRSGIAWSDGAAGPVLRLAAADDQPRWQDLGACREIGDDLWFPEKGGSVKEAKAICQGCEVRAECLSYAMAAGEKFGIWGGLSERERQRLKRRQVA